MVNYAGGDRISAIAETNRNALAMYAGKAGVHALDKLDCIVSL